MRRNYLIIGLFFLNLIQVFSQGRGDSKPIPQVEYQALVDFYNSMNGKNWVEKWNIKTKTTDMESWLGVDFDRDGHVTGLNLISQNLKGAVPKSITKLQYLERVDFSAVSAEPFGRNDLGTPIAGLTTFGWGDDYGPSLPGPSLPGQPGPGGFPEEKPNDLSGTDLNLFSKLPNLDFLDLSGCNLGGVVPNSFKNLKKLSTLTLARNSFTDIDASFFEKVDFLDVSSQKLKLPKLEFQGKDVVIPFKNFPNIIKYNVREGDFSYKPSFSLYVNGEVSRDFDYIQVNRSGNIILPKSALSALNSELDVYLIVNEGVAGSSKVSFEKVIIKTAPVPTEEYKALVDFYNAMGGTKWINKWDVRKNNLNEGSWYGVTIKEGHVTEINLDHNNIKGAIPASIKNLKYLKVLNLSNYEEEFEFGINGTVLPPPSLVVSNHDLSTTKLDVLSSLSNLEHLNLSKCNLVGSIPKSLEKLTKLEDLDLSYNKLSDIKALLPADVFISINNQEVELPKLVYKGSDVVISGLPRIIKYNRRGNNFTNNPSFELFINGENIRQRGEQALKADSKGNLTLPKEKFASYSIGDKVYLQTDGGAAYETKITFKEVSVQLKSIPDSEFKALVDLYNATGGKNWTKKWDITKNNFDKQTWYGLSIFDGHVIGIDLSYNELKGELPKSLENLTKLRKLNLVGNSLTGTKALLPKYVDLSIDSQTVTFPELVIKGDDVILSNLPAIASYNREKNNFTFKPTYKLYVSSSRLGGTQAVATLKADEKGNLVLPKEHLAKYRKGADIYLEVADGAAHNTSIIFNKVTVKLNGIPDSEYKALVDLYNATDGKNWLRKWDVSKNNFDKGAWLGVTVENGHVVSIDLSNNELDGFVPKSIENLKKLTSFDVSGNGIYDIKASFPKTVKTVKVHEQVLFLPSLTYKGQDVVVNIPKIVNYNREKNDFSSKVGISVYIGRSIVAVNLQAKDGKLTIASNFLSSLKKGDRLYLKSSDGDAYYTRINFRNLNLELPSVPKEEYEALVDLFKSTGGKDWVKSWDVSKNNLYEGTWAGVSVNKGHVVAIDLRGNNLKGFIPKSIEKLTKLTSLDLSRNAISDIKALLPQNVTLKLDEQTIEISKVVYKGGDLVLSNLPNITKYNRKNNDFKNNSSFDLYLKNMYYGYRKVGTYVFDKEGKLVLPKKHFANVTKSEDFYLVLNNSSANRTDINFKEIIFDLPKVSDQEYKALVDLYKATSGSKWSRKWNVSTNDIHKGNWYGVSVANGHVVSLELEDNNLKGKLPASIKNLKYLNKLNLSNSGYSRRVNDLTGSNLEGISNLVNLEVLNLRGVKLNTAIPASFSKLTKLNRLSLGNNKAITSLEVLSKLSALQYLDLSGSNLKSVPASWSSLTKLRELDLSNNSISNIDASFAKLKLDDFSFDSQTITKESITFIGSTTKVQLPLHLVVQGRDRKLDFNANNRFELYIDGRLVSNATSKGKELVFSNIRGSRLTTTSKVKILQNSGNARSSEITFTKVNFGKAIPDTEYQVLKKLYTSTKGKYWTNKWNVSTNNLHQAAWYGVAIENGHVVGLDLSNNNLSGVVTADLAKLTKLKVLNLSGNKFIGTIPAVLTKLPAIEKLDLSNNGFSKLEKGFTYNASKTAVNLVEQKITSKSYLTVKNGKLEVELSDIVKYDIAKNNYEAKNKFTLLVDGWDHDTAEMNAQGKIVFGNIKLGEIKKNSTISIIQTSGTFTNTEFIFAGISDKEQTKLVEEEYEALKKLYFFLNGNRWKNQWDVSSNNLHVKKWYGVTVKEGHVVSIELSNNGLSGTIPSLLNKFTKLTKFDVSSNGIASIDEGIKGLPSGLKVNISGQIIDGGTLKLIKSSVVIDYSINKYNFKKQQFVDQTYELKAGKITKKIKLPKQGMKLSDIAKTWKVEKGEKITLKQLSGDAINSVVTYSVDFKDGDANMDGMVNFTDYRVAVNFIRGRRTKNLNYLAIDLDRNSKINKADLSKIISIIRSNSYSYIYGNKQELAPIDLIVSDKNLIMDTKENTVEIIYLTIGGVSTDDLEDLFNQQDSKEHFSEILYNEAKGTVDYVLNAFVKGTGFSGKVEILKFLKPGAKILSARLSRYDSEKQGDVEFPVNIISETLGIEDGLTLEAGQSVNVYPNPFVNQANITFKANTAQKVNISVFNQLGAQVYTDTVDALNGKNNYVFNKGALSSGVYIYVIRLGDSKNTLKGKMIIK